MPSHPDLVALLGSRICHDLISPIGAIGNGLELLMLEGSTRGPEMALISESVTSANARIKFFRIAFGVSSSDQRVSRAEAVRILADLTKGGRLTIDWQIREDIARTEAKRVFLAILCLETGMPFGGRIAINRDDKRWTVTGQAPRMKIDLAIWDLLSNPQAAAVAITPAIVHFPLLAADFTGATRGLVTELRETEITLSF